MDKTIDLHLHSTCSDGLRSPEEVVALAAERGVIAIALADHDNIDGIDRAMVASRNLGVEVLSGVELSVVWESLEDIHLLGYGFDHHHEELVSELKGFQDFRANRNAKIVERVNEKLSGEGWPQISFERVRELAGGTFGRPHIGRALQELEHITSMEQAFDDYLIPCNVNKRFFPIAEAIALIHRAGGLAVLAHPPFIPGGRETFLKLLESTIPMGLDGVEVFNSGARGQERDWTLTEVVRRGLLVTGGSDDHGSGDDAREPGALLGSLEVPYHYLEKLKVALAKVV